MSNSPGDFNRMPATPFLSTLQTLQTFKLNNISKVPGFSRVARDAGYLASLLRAGFIIKQLLKKPG
jgi:hypothetical protein